MNLTAQDVRPLLLKREVAALRLGISLRTLDELVASRRLPSVKVGKRRLISEESILNFVRKAERNAR